MIWEKVRLGKVSESCLGKMLDQNKNTGSFQPYLANVNVRWGSFNLDNLQEMKFEDSENERYGLKYGDLVICEGGEPGRCAIWKEQLPNMKIQKALHRVRVKEDMDYRFVYYWFLLAGKTGVLKQYYTGATIMHMPGQKLKEVIIDKPPLEIQVKIADILSAYDDLIENNQKQIKLLEEAAQRLYKEWFVDLRFPGHEAVKIVDGVPEGWEHVQLMDVLKKITTGLNPRKNFVLGSGKNYYVTIKNMRDNDIYLDDKCDKVDDEALEKINKRSDLRTGDILFSGIGTMGRVYLISIPTDNWNVSESVFTMRANEKISKELLYLILLSDDVQNYCELNAHGAAQRGIRMADLKAYKFNLPPNEIIRNFTSLVIPILAKVQKIRSENLILSEARDRLLPKLISGEIQV